MNDSADSVSELSPLFRRLLAKRGLTEPEAVAAFLDPSLDRLYDPRLLKGAAEAAERVRLAAAQSEKILIHGDYDADGITGAAIVAKTLEALRVNYRLFLPNRAEDGYGVSARALAAAREDRVRVLITVDCGITAHEEIRAAKEQGLDVIVIDHHEIPASGLPPADVIINPHQPDCGYPFDGLSAAGLAFKLASLLLGVRAFEFLDLAALSTVCDVAPLTDENRVIVASGLARISKRQNTGIRALAETAGMRGAEANTGHLGFVLGPRINAAGRMSSPEIALRLLLTPHLKEASSLAAVLEEENRSRQREERQMLRQAVSVVERTVSFRRDRVIVAAHQGWHPGVIGIVASRLVEKYQRPAVVIALDGKTGKGSARSLKGFALHEAFQACAAHLEEFGGHALAAGLSIREEAVEEFRKAINAYAAGLDPAIFVRKVEADLEISLADLGPQFLKELKQMEPHGMGNPRPVFRAKGVRLKGHPQWASPQTLKFWVTEGGQTFESVWTDRSGDLDASLLEGEALFDLFFTVRLSSWKGVETVSLDVKSLVPKF